jgi:hypothetical protein
VHVAGITVITHTAYANLGLFHILVGKTNAVKHGLRGGLGWVAGKVFTVFVEFGGSYSVHYFVSSYC